MLVRIDENSGCCNGVGRAISKAEEYLKHHDTLFSLGAIVHNDAEIARLADKGLKTIGYNDLPSLGGRTVLIRAHGEPPSTYRMAEEYNIGIIDCTCPVVLALQKKIAAKYAEMKACGGCIVIFGERGHAEVNGLVGQTDGSAVVTDSMEDLKVKIDTGKIRQDRRTALFSQTTKDPVEFAAIAEMLKKYVEPGKLEVSDTICRLVSSRHQALTKFAQECSVIFFVCGRESSNGKVLYELCRKVNPKSFKIENCNEIDLSCLKDDDIVGICGATSTTGWQLEEVAGFIRSSCAGRPF